MHAAVANGADAVYFGIANFNARHRAENAQGEQLPQTLLYLHSHNVRGYVALNTLIFSDELDQVAKCVIQIAESGADAVIVQDLGILYLVGLMTPTLPRHGSTQMTLTDARGIDVIGKMGVSRVILPRELSTADIARITAQTQVAVEVFCHGALCVSYSGQCLTSESIGGRSANRGMCAQACRLPYELIVDGKKFDAKGRLFLLSPQDIAAYDRVADLAKAGVAALKIEGRLKSAQYVAATTAAYRSAVDAIGRPFTISPLQQAQLTQSFSRGFTHGFLDGVNHQKLVVGGFSKKRGMQIATVVSHTPEGIVITLLPGKQIKAGDGIVFDEGHPEQDEQGGRVYSMRHTGKGQVEIRFMPGSVVAAAVATGAQVWKTDDPAINRQLTQTYNRDVVAHRESLICDVRAVVGEPLRIELRDSSGREVMVETEQPMQTARNHPLDEALVRDQIGRLGDTPYELGKIHLHGKGDADAPEPVMAPKSVLNDLRRNATAKLMSLRGASVRHDVAAPAALADLRAQIEKAYPPASGESFGAPQLTVMARSMEQLQAVCRWRPGSTDLLPCMVWCDFENVGDYPEAVEFARRNGRKIGLVTLRIIKPGEDRFLNQMGQCWPDAILVRNLSSIAYLAANFPTVELVGDYSLNVTNELSAWVLLKQLGLARLTPSHDLNWLQLQAMLSRISGRVFEVVLHQQMPMFHNEHCLFAHLLSDGKDSRDCQRPCEKHRVSLRDRMGVEHPVHADAGCRNTVFNGRAQGIAGYAQQLRRLGVNYFRVELLRETARETTDLLDYYAAIQDGRTSAPLPNSRLRILNMMGVTPGTMEFK